MRLDESERGDNPVERGEMTRLRERGERDAGRRS
jgi:hypothetical protein